MNTLWRSGRGLWAVALLAAALVPVFLHVATLHRVYWAGSLGADFWQDAVRPWSARLWAAVGIMTLSGFASTAATTGRREIVPRLGAGLAAGGLGLGVWLLASTPGLVWLARLGVEGVPFTFAIAGLAVLAAALASGATGGFLPGAPAAASGGVAGALVLSACWGHLT